MLVDANILLYAVDRRSPLHERAAEWWTDALRGDRRVGIPWQTIGAFTRIITHPRVTTDPLRGDEAWSHVSDWLAARPVWIPPATERTAAVFASLVDEVPVSGNLVPDAMLAALAIEHGLTVVSTDSDFSRFPGVRSENPLA